MGRCSFPSLISLLLSSFYRGTYNTCSNVLASDDHKVQPSALFGWERREENAGVSSHALTEHMEEEHAEQFL